MSKIFKRIRELYLENKEDIKTSVIVSLAMILVLLIVFIMLLASMCSDLVDRVQDQEYAMQEMTVDKLSVIFNTSIPRKRGEV